jgi:hypothetical protein
MANWASYIALANEMCIPNTQSAMDFMSTRAQSVFHANDTNIFFLFMLFLDVFGQIYFDITFCSILP